MDRKQAEFYDQFHAERMLRDRDMSNARHLVLRQLINKTIIQHSWMRKALEIGCGVGVTSHELDAMGLKVTGIDISERNISFCSEVYPHHQWIHADIVSMSAHRLGKFDLITLFDVLEHIDIHQHYSVLHKLVTKCAHNRTLFLINHPDAEFLDYWRQHYPHQLQRIDVSITFGHLISISSTAGLQVQQFWRYGVEWKNQYNYWQLRVQQPFIKEPVHEL